MHRLRNGGSTKDLNETVRARKWFCSLIGLAMLIGLIANIFAADVQYNPENSPVADGRMEDAIAYGCWAWSSRLDVDCQYTGLTGETVADGKVIVRWENLGMQAIRFLTEPEAGLVEHRADSGLSWTIGYARWWTREGVLVKAEVVLNTFLVSRSVNKCTLELIIHEIGHVLVSPQHSDRVEDVMYSHRGHCRYSPSLSDLQRAGMPITSCHVELTPHGELEYLDHKGERISLIPTGLGKWALNHDQLYRNPLPMWCPGIHVANGEVWAGVKSFLGESGLYKFKSTAEGLVRF